MPELGEVVGAVLAETVRARLVADALTADLLSAYREDDALVSLSVPRATITQLQVTLRFSAGELQRREGPVGVPKTRMESEWNSVLAQRVLPRVLRTVTSDLSADDRVAIRSHVEPEMIDARAAPVLSRAAMEMRAEEAPAADELAKASVETVLDQLRSVPTSLRRRMGTIAALREEIDVAVRDELGPFLDRTHELTVARETLRSRLDVVVDAAHLESAPPQSLQELTITLGMQDVETIVAQGGAVPPGGPA